MPRTLLLADASDLAHELVEEALAGSDFDLIWSKTGNEALQVARGLRPDIVLAQATLPGIDGYAVCEAIKQAPELLGVPVLIMTDAFERYDEARALIAGANQHITKPIRADILRQRLEELLPQNQANPLLAPLPSDSRSLRRKANPVMARTPMTDLSNDSPGDFGNLLEGETLEGDDDLLDVLPLPKDEVIEEGLELDPLSFDPLDDDFDFGTPTPAPTPQPESAPPAELQAPTPSLQGRDEIRDSIGTMTAEILPELPEDLSQELIETLVERFEAIAWEVIPKLAETLVREEIRRMKESDL
ncbi:MAG: response regulator [Myxococcota bacterium]|jgi:DNA-binding response OmpR family regulator|nr:response regulator [Myxococcota bacterium]